MKAQKYIFTTWIATKNPAVARLFFNTERLIYCFSAHPVINRYRLKHGLLYFFHRDKTYLLNVLQIGIIVLVKSVFANHKKIILKRNYIEGVDV